MRATNYQRVGAGLVVGIFIALTQSACGGGGDEAVDEQTAVAPGDDASPTPTPDDDGFGAGTCSATGRPDASRRGLSDAQRRALVASCNGLPPGFIDIGLNFQPPPPVPASGAKK
jgi:hypothetical protein